MARWMPIQVKCKHWACSRTYALWSSGTKSKVRDSLKRRDRITLFSRTKKSSQKIPRIQMSLQKRNQLIILIQSSTTTRTAPIARKTSILTQMEEAAKIQRMHKNKLQE